MVVTLANQALRIICIIAALGMVSMAQANPYVAAALPWSNGKVQLFLSDGTYLRYDTQTERIDPGYPKPVNDTSWPGLGRFAKLISAAFSGPSGKVYFFMANGDYVRFDVAADHVDPDYPQPINDSTWPGLGPYHNQIFGAINWTNNRVQMFLSNGSYVRFDLGGNRMDDGYPKRISKETWPGLAPYAANLAGMVNWNNRKAYFFLDNNTFLRYDIASDRLDEGYPKPLDETTWPGIARAIGHRPAK